MRPLCACVSFAVLVAISCTTSGCGAIVGAIAGLFSSSNKEPAQNAAATVSLNPTGIPEAGFYEGNISLEFIVQDAEGDSLGIDPLFFFVDAGSNEVQSPATADFFSKVPGDRWEQTSGPLRASPDGLHYMVTWHSSEDVTIDSPTRGVLAASKWGLNLQEKGTDKSHRYLFTAPLDNAPAPKIELASIAPESTDWVSGGSVFGIVDVQFAYSCLIPCELRIEAYERISGSNDFLLLPLSQSLFAEQQAKRAQLRWNTVHVAIDSGVELQLRGTRVVEGKNAKQAILSLGPISVDNSAPDATILAPHGRESFAGPIRLDLLVKNHVEADVALQVYYTDELLEEEIDSGELWSARARPATILGTSASGGLQTVRASTHGTFKRMVWDTFFDTEDREPWPAHVPYASGKVIMHVRGRNPYSGQYSPWTHSQLFFVDQALMTTVAGETTASGVPATEAQFAFSLFGSSQNAGGLAAGNDGSLYIADSYHNIVRRIEPSGIIFTIAGNGLFGFSGDGKSAVEGSFARPEGVAIGEDGSIYIADTGNNRIRRVSPRGVLSTFAGSGPGATLGMAPGAFADGPANQAKMSWPLDVLSDLRGNIFVADTQNHRVRQVSQGIMATVAGNGQAGFSGDNGPAAAAMLASPSALALGSDLSVYVADSGNQRIRRISANGIITSVAGSSVVGDMGDGGLALNAQLSFPSGIAISPNGNVYVSDTGNSRIRAVSPAGIITSVAGIGAFGFSGEDCPASACAINSPLKLAVGVDRQPVFIDSGNNRLRRLSDNSLLTIGGRVQNEQEVLGTDVVFTRPSAIAVGKDGSLVVVDAGANAMVVVSPNGVATRVGGGPEGLGGDNGPARDAKFSIALCRFGCTIHPACVAISDSGSIYLSDSGNNRIRVIGSDGLIRTIAVLTVPRGITLDSDNALIVCANVGVVRLLPGGEMPVFVGTENDYPAAVTMGPDGSLYYTELCAGVVKRIDKAGNLSSVMTIPGFPTGIACRGDGTIFLSIQAGNSHSIISRSPDGTIRTVAGGVERGFSGDGKDSRESRLSVTTFWGDEVVGGASELAISSEGYIYLADIGNGRIRRFFDSSE